MSRDLLQRLEGLPESLQKEVMDFIEYLISKGKPVRKGAGKKTPTHFKWQGALKGKYKGTTSVELQHKIWD